MKTKINPKDLFARYRQKKLVLFYNELDKNNDDIVAACRLANIDYHVLLNWMKFEPELKARIKEACSVSEDDISRVFNRRLNGRDINKTPEVIGMVLEAYASGIGIVKACQKVAGINYNTWHAWCKTDPKLQAMVDVIKDAEVSAIKSVFLQKLKEGKGHFMEYIFFLTNKFPDEYKQKQEVTHEIGENLIEKLKGKSVPELKERFNELTGAKRFSTN